MFAAFETSHALLDTNQASVMIMPYTMPLQRRHAKLTIVHRRIHVWFAALHVTWLLFVVCCVAHTTCRIASAVTAPNVWRLGG